MRKTAAAVMTVVLLLSLMVSVSAEAESAHIQSLALVPGEDTAQVHLTADETCTLLVALYGEDNRMLGLGAQTAGPGEHTLSVRLSTKAPERFSAKAFLLNEVNAPLCENFLLDRTGSSPTPGGGDGKVLIAYFSATNNTESIANHLNTILDADLYEIVPETPYTSADLNYTTDCRANREQNDSSARPAISGGVNMMEQYDVIFLGYPIWWGQAPKIISTFLESYDLSGKTIVPFCTSGSSGIGSSASTLHSLASAAVWMDGQRFSGSASRSAVENWVNGLGLTLPPAETAVNKIAVSFNRRTYTATLADNSSAKAFAELLKNGPLTISARDYGNFEKVGPLGTLLPQNNTQITTLPGDIILYQGNQITVYYAQNSWSLTRLGKIDAPTGLR